MKIHAMYFSPTDTTKKIICDIAKRVYQDLEEEAALNYINFTPYQVRKSPISFGNNDLLIIGVPVYAGRVPNVLLKYLNKIIGSSTLVIPIVVYGNRNYDDALIELKTLLESNGFTIIAAASFIGEHSFSNTLAKGRPDEKDMKVVKQFAQEIVKNIHSLPNKKEITVPGQQPLRPYYTLRDKNGNVFDFKKITPKTSDKCINCKLCVDLCPMGSICPEDVSKLNGICIKCCACVKHCPMKAKYFDDPSYLKHKEELENNFAKRREPELFY